MRHGNMYVLFDLSIWKKAWLQLDDVLESGRCSDKGGSRKAGFAFG